MLNDENRYKKLLGKFIDFDKWEKVNHQGRSGYDATKPSFLIIVTIAYVAIVFFITLGIPMHGIEPEPIPAADLPYAMPIFIVIYVVVVGGLYLRDKYRMKR